jgi:short-chain Z-isoprenyl diphosphate synthase
VGLRNLLYGAYERRLAARLPAGSLPRHVGVMLDGNRRWARANGANTEQGHQAGADNILPLLGWCEDVGVEVVTLWLLSTDNLNRPAAELTPLLSIIESVVTDLAAEGRWRLNPVGALDLLPDPTAHRLKDAADLTRGV